MSLSRTKCVSSIARDIAFGVLKTPTTRQVNNGMGLAQGTHLVQTGVYTWRITLKKKNGQGADVYTGHVSVIR